MDDGLIELEKKNYYLKLISLYSPLLTKRQKEIMGLYFEQDLSYMEIAETLDISKNAVHLQVQTIKSKMDYYEKKLQLNKKNEEILKRITDYESSGDPKKLNEIKEIINNGI